MKVNNLIEYNCITVKFIHIDVVYICPFVSHRCLVSDSVYLLGMPYKKKS